MLDRKALELVQRVMASQSLAQAAATMHLTPSALSHQLRELEERVGGTLIERKKRPFRLTPLGAMVLDAAQQILPLFAQYEERIAKHARHEAGRLNLAIECHSCYQWLMPTLDEFREQWAEVTVDIVSGYLFSPLQALVDRELDIVITADPESLAGVSYIPLFEYESVLVVDKHHPLATKGEVWPQDLASETLIIYPVDTQKLNVYRDFLNPAGVAPAATRQAEITTVMMQLVAAGRGVTAVPSWAAHEYVERGFLVALTLGEGVYSTLYAALRDADLARPYVQDFLLLAKDLPLNTLSGVVRPGEQVS